VLHREKILENLLSLQTLDVIDGDGAVLIYKRLVDHFEGSQSEAESAIQQHYISINDISPGSASKSSSLLSASPYPMPKCHHLHELLHMTRQFQAHLQSQRQAGVTVDKSTSDKYHTECNLQVENLSKESCIYLLVNWLLSLTMCDVSIFVTFNLLPVNDDAVECNQSVDNEGMFLCRWESMSNLLNAIVRYQVKIIDCDPKPVSKLRNRQDVEKMFQFCEMNATNYLLEAK
jgi:inositol-pentakisphosphate 2-kinase